jgi:hypothetical protein
MVIDQSLAESGSDGRQVVPLKSANHFNLEVLVIVGQQANERSVERFDCIHGNANLKTTFPSTASWGLQFSAQVFDCLTIDRLNQLAGAFPCSIAQRIESLEVATERVFLESLAGSVSLHFVRAIEMFQQQRGCLR